MVRVAYIFIQLLSERQDVTFFALIAPDADQGALTKGLTGRIHQASR